VRDDSSASSSAAADADAPSGPSPESSAHNEFVRAELTTLHGSEDAYDELIEALHASMGRVHDASAREADGIEGAAEEMLEALKDAGKAHWDAGMLEEAREAYEDALRRAIDLHGGGGGGADDMPVHPAVASLLHLLGNVHARSGAGDEARRWYESSLSMKKSLYGKRAFHPEVGRTLNGLAMLLIASSSGTGSGKWKPRLRPRADGSGGEDGSEDWMQALRLLEEAERNYVFYKYDDLKHTPEHRVNGGGTGGAGKTGGGGEWDHDVEPEGNDDTLGDLADHPDVGHINENIADLYRRAEDFEPALGRYLEALRVKELWMPNKMDGPATVGTDPKGMTLMMSIADCLAALNRNDEAAEQYEIILGEHLKAVKVRSGGSVTTGSGDDEGGAPADNLIALASFSDDETGSATGETAGTALESVLRHNIATMHSRSHRYDLALEQYRLALSIKRAMGGDSHPEVAHTLNAMGAMYGSMGESQSSLAHFREALYVYRLAVRTGEDENDHPDVVDVKRNIKLVEGGLMKDEGNIDPLS